MKFGTNGLYLCRNRLALQKFKFPSPPSPPGGPCPPRGTFRTNRQISMKFGANGPYLSRNRLALQKFSFSTPSPPPPRGVHDPPGGLLELNDRFCLNLVQMVLTYVGLDWNCQNYNSPPPFPPSGGGLSPFYPQGGFFQLIDIFQ